MDWIKAVFSTWYGVAYFAGFVLCAGSGAVICFKPKLNKFVISINSAPKPIFHVLVLTAIIVGGVFLYAIYGVVSFQHYASIEKATVSDSDEVTYLINKLTENPDEEQKAIFELERMKQDAIPYIVGHLGDTRPLANPEFLLLNPPEVKFEKYAHLGAANIHGALVFILHWSVRSELPRPPLELAAPISESKQQWVSWCHQQYPRYASACDGL